MLAKCANYKITTTKLLLEFNTSLAIQSDRDGATLLHHAAYTGNIDLTRVLIQMGADVNAVLQSQPSYWRLIGNIDPASMTPMRIALEMGSSVSGSARELFMSLSLLIETEDQRLMKALINKGRISPGDDYTQLISVLKRNAESLTAMPTDKRLLDIVTTGVRWSQFSVRAVELSVEDKEALLIAILR